MPAGAILEAAKAESLVHGSVGKPRICAHLSEIMKVSECPFVRFKKHSREYHYALVTEQHC